jgi:hypothetical protein
MSGWSKLEKYLKSKNLNILIIKEFIMPDMSISEYIDWLTTNRLGEDLESRINKSGWEIQKAATKANLILTNRIRENVPTLNYIAKTIINQIIETANLTEFLQFETATNTLPEIKTTEEIISAHDNIK